MIASQDTRTTRSVPRCTACRMTRQRTLAALGLEEEAYARAHVRRHVDLLTVLTSPAKEDICYELRFVVRPAPLCPSRGRVDVALFARLEPASTADAEDYGRDLLGLLRASFPEYDFEQVATAGLNALLRHFEVADAASILRRDSLERLDTLAPGERRPRRLGFLVDRDTERETPDEARVLHVFPFLATWAPYDALLRLLPAQPEPSLLSIWLRPTELARDERALLEAQVVRCEQHAQAMLNGPTPIDLSNRRPTLHEQARSYQLGRLRGLSDDAALLSIRLASAGPIPEMVAEAAGTLFTLPAGCGARSHAEASGAHLAGGYSICRPQNPRELEAARTSIETLAASRLEEAIAVPGSGRLVQLFDATEAASAFRLPPTTAEGLPGAESVSWRDRPVPRSLPESGVLLGSGFDGGDWVPVRLAREGRRRHTYVVGQTGTGKSTLPRTMILDDIESGEGLCFIDPHGDLFREVLDAIPRRRRDDVVVIDLSDETHPFALNLLECESVEERQFVVQEFTGILTKLVADKSGLAAAVQFMGPLFLQHVRMNLLLVMSSAAGAGTLLDFYDIFEGGGAWKKWLPLSGPDPLLDRWVARVLPRTDYQRPTNDGITLGGYVSSKFQGFLFDPNLRRIFAEPKSTVDIGTAMDEGRILLVNLAKGELSEPNSRFFGMVLLAKLQAAAMARSRIPTADRRDFHLYVDEFQSVSTQSFSTLLSEARKFRGSIVLANRFLSQIADERVLRAIFGNVGTILAFRVGVGDAEILERELGSAITSAELCGLPNWRAYASMLIGGQAERGFTVRTSRAGET